MRDLNWNHKEHKETSFFSFVLFVPFVVQNLGCLKALYGKAFPLKSVPLVREMYRRYAAFWLILLLSGLSVADESKKVIVITGASSGIAQAAAERFAKDSRYKVYGTTRQSALVGQHPLGYTLVLMDPGNSQSVEQALRVISNMENRIDVLINSAGHMVLGSVESVDPDRQLLDLFNVNVVGYARTTRTVVPVMRRNGGGRIINITSIQAVEPRGMQESYSATRAAVEVMSLGQNSYLKQYGIDVLVYEPGATNTAFMDSTSLGEHQVSGDKTLEILPEFAEMMRQRLAAGMSPALVADQLYALANDKQPDFRSFATPAVLQRASAMLIEPAGNGLRQLLKDKYDQFVGSLSVRPF